MSNPLEQFAWRLMSRRTNRLFLVLAITVAAALSTSGLAAAWVSSRNADTIADARESGLDLARASAEFSTRLTAYDAEATTTLLAGGITEPAARSGYDPDLLETGRPLAGYDPNLSLAALALVDAGLVATDEDHRDLRTLNEGLVRYTRLVETARTNSLQGNPVNAAYLNQARTIAQEDLLPVADGLRRTGERRVAQAANDVGGPVSAAAVALLALALSVLVATTLVAAGRTRRVVHPALLAATAAAVVGLAIVTTGIWSQSRDLREAATTDIAAYVEANEVAADLADLRVTEITAVATQGRGEDVYARFHTDAGDLAERLDGTSLLAPLNSYVDEVDEVEQLAQDGERQDAADSTREGDSATQFGLAYDTSSDQVIRAAADLDDRFDDVAAADTEPLVPIALGVVAALLGAGGILARGRQYR